MNQTVQKQMKLLERTIRANSEFSVRSNTYKAPFEQYEPNIQISVEFPDHEKHVQEPFCVMAIQDTTGKVHWFINAWFYRPKDEADKKVWDTQIRLIKELLKVMPDINIEMADLDWANYNVKGSWPTEGEDGLWCMKKQLDLKHKFNFYPES